MPCPSHIAHGIGLIIHAFSCHYVNAPGLHATYQRLPALFLANRPKQRYVGGMMKQFSSLRRAHKVALMLLAGFGLAACAHDPHRHYYHPGSNHGRAAPGWYRPPLTPQQGTNPYKHSTTNYGGGTMRYDQ